MNDFNNNPVQNNENSKTFVLKSFTSRFFARVQYIKALYCNKDTSKEVTFKKYDGFSSDSELKNFFLPKQLFL